MSKKRATDYERDLGDKFWNSGFAVMRAPSSSGTSKYPRPDLLVGSLEKGKILALELKTARQDTFYVSKDQINGLIEFSRIFGAKPYLVVKYVGKRMGYRFLSVPNDLKESSGKSYRIAIQDVKEKGKEFEEMVK
ncbi:MAG: Holliday junction resolvase Hjc [Candidatus Heimdallarchaeaceae archaeon]